MIDKIKKTKENKSSKAKKNALVKSKISKATKKAPISKEKSKDKTVAKPKSITSTSVISKSVQKTSRRKNTAKEIPERLVEEALKVLEQRKAEEIVVVDLRGRTAVADYALIATGGSSRALNALSEYIREAFFKLGHKQLRIEGLPQGDWVLIDAGDVLIHLFRPEVRSFYNLEDIWTAGKTTTSK